VRTGQARRIDLPGALAHSDEGYASAFALATPRARAMTSEQWARAVFEQGPAPLRSFVEVGWRALLGLRLGPRHSPGHVAGWTIAAVDERPDTVTLTAESRLLRARNVVAVDEGVVEWVTTVQFDRRLGRIAWTLAAPVHSVTIPYLLTRAERAAGERPVPSRPETAA
jgi:hypothetical protein